MSRVVAYLLRCIAILAGYAAACLAASAFIHLIVFAAAGFEPQDARDAPALFGPFAFSVPFVALFVAYFAFIPAAAVILVAEILARRGWLFYALGGGFAAGAVLAFLGQSGDPDFMVGDTMPVLALIGAGIVGGFCYWLVAGRGAGTRPQAPPISREP
jgi:hypothetical protein